MDTISTKSDNRVDEVGSKNWCNFCGYSTENLDDYLKHSCVDVLKATGQTVQPSSTNSCK